MSAAGVGKNKTKWRKTEKGNKDIEIYREEFERRERKLKIGCPLLLEALRFGSENSDICQFSQHSFHLVK